MPFYETVFMARQDLSEAQVKEITTACEKIITGMKGKVHKTEFWGLRALAYRINKNRKAHYVLLETDAPAEAVQEVERTLRLNEDVLRYLTVREDALSTGPSVVLDKNASNDIAFDREAA